MVAIATIATHDPQPAQTGLLRRKEGRARPSGSGPPFDGVLPGSGKADLGAGLLQLRLGGLGSLLRRVLQDRLRRGLDQVLGFLQAEAGDQLADDLDDLDLLLTGGLEDDV